MPEATLRQAITKRSLTVGGHRTSISLETVFWNGLCRLAAEHSVSTAALVTQIDAQRDGLNLSSAIRVYVFEQSVCGSRLPSGRP